MYKNILFMLTVLHSVYASCMNNEFHGEPSCSPLHAAIANRNQAAVIALLDQPCDLEALDELGQTPLLRAASCHETTTIAQLLLNAGANPNAAVHGRTALHYATTYDKSSFARSLVHKGAFLNPVCLEDGYTPLHYAVIHHATSTIVLLCDEGADVTIKSTYGMTPLEIAVRQNSLETSSTLLMHDSNRSEKLLCIALNLDSAIRTVFLLNAGIKISNQTLGIQQKVVQLLKGQVSPLINAIITFDINTFKDTLNFLNHLSDPGDHNFEKQKFDEMKKALLLAYAQGFLEHAALLESTLQGKSVPLMQVYLNALMSAVSCGDTPLCALLAQKITPLISENSFLLNLAAKLGHQHIAQLLLSKQNLRPTLKYAVSSRHYAAIEVLLNAGAPSDEVEVFLKEDARKQGSTLETTFFANLLSRLTAYKEIMTNPPPETYFPQLCTDVRVFVLALMLRTQRPT